MNVTGEVTQWRDEGFVVLRAHLSTTDLEESQRALPKLFPTADEYHSGTNEKRNARYRGHEFVGLVTFPFSIPSLCLLAVHPQDRGRRRGRLRDDRHPHLQR